MKSLYWVLVVVVIAAGMFLYIALSQAEWRGRQYDDFAKCLTEKGATMYGAEWCPHCRNQKAMFGTSFHYINYVECPQNENICKAKGIKGYLTWIINGKKYVGEKTLETLASLTGCPLNKEE